MAVVLDSSVVVGFLDRSDHLHAAADEAVRDLLERERLVVSVVTYAEVLSGARLGHHEENRVAGFFAELVSHILPVDAAIADCAAGLRARATALRMPDALIAATAELDPEVDLLLSGDRRLARLKGLACPLRAVADRGA